MDGSRSFTSSDRAADYADGRGRDDRCDRRMGCGAEGDRLVGVGGDVGDRLVDVGGAVWQTARLGCGGGSGPQSLYGSNSFAPAMTTMTGRSVCNTSTVAPCWASTSGRRR